MSLRCAPPGIRPAFRGRGGSSWDPVRDDLTNAYVGDIEKLVASLGLTRCSIVGHSMGGTGGYALPTRHADQVAPLSDDHA